MAPARKKLRGIQLDVARFAQPCDTTCGPTCLAQIYRYYNDPLPLRDIIARTQRNPDGGTVAVYLGLSALASGYKATIYPYNVRIFDPTWKLLGPKVLMRRLKARARVVSSKRLRRILLAYARFLKRGGRVKFRTLSPELLVRLLSEKTPILTGLSSTYLYEEPRQSRAGDDDIGGDPEGHFVVISGYKARKREFIIRDPSVHIPFSANGRYSVSVDRLISAILLGDVTYDANLLIVKPRRKRRPPGK